MVRYNERKIYEGDTVNFMENLVTGLYPLLHLNGVSPASPPPGSATEYINLSRLYFHLLDLLSVHPSDSVVLRSLLLVAFHRLTV